MCSHCARLSLASLTQSSDRLAKEISSWSNSCHAGCFCSAMTPASPAEPPAPSPTNLTSVPPQYHDLASVFSKGRALSLPPTTAPSSCFLVLHYPRVVSTTFPNSNNRQWRSTSGIPWLLALSVLRSLRLERSFSSSERRMVHCVPALISEASAAFLELRTRFTEAPILAQPEPKLQFIVEVDASDTEAGAELSQCSLKDNKLHLCALHISNALAKVKSF